MVLDIMVIKKGFLIALDVLRNVCNDAKVEHDGLLGLMSHQEVAKHEIWFKAKMHVNNNCFSNTKEWLAKHKINRVMVLMMGLNQVMGQT